MIAHAQILDDSNSVFQGYRCSECYLIFGMERTATAATCCPGCGALFGSSDRKIECLAKLSKSLGIEPSELLLALRVVSLGTRFGA